MIIIHSTYAVQMDKKIYAHELMVHMANVALRSEECISYEFFFSVDQADKVLLVQEWRSMEAAEKHYQTAPVRMLTSELPRVLAGVIETRAFSAHKTVSKETDALSSYHANPAYFNNNRTVH
jgi:quinol monooxygenase YgiN